MIRKTISIIVIFSILAAHGYDTSFTRDLASRNFSAISIHNVKLSHTLKKHLDSVQASNSEIQNILTSTATKDIFTIDLSSYGDLSIANSVRILQYLILLSLYEKMFQHYIVASEAFLNDLLIAKKYWMYEDFYMKQPFFSKNILYNFYSSEYQNKITAKLTALHELENNIAGILGFCLYGLSSIQKVNNENVIVEQMIIIVDQFFKLLNTFELNHELKNNPFILYNHALWMHENIKQHMNSAQLGMQQNGKTFFLVDHWVGISCAAIAIIGAAIMYAKHEQTVKSLCEQGKIAAPNFWQEYIVNPVVGLKEVVWDQKTKTLQHIEHFPDISLPDTIKLKPFPKLSDIPQSPDLPKYAGYVDSMLNPAIDMVNVTKKDLITTANVWKDDIVTAITERQNDIQIYCNMGIQELVNVMNQWKDASEKTLNTKIDEANDTIIKNNQINMYLATIGPVLFGTYLLGSSSYKAYDHYIRNKNWYTPMRYIIHSIDQLVNQIARSSTEHSFVDDGKLYMLIQHFRGYIVCLNNEELFLMYNDINELLSFDLNYAQKKGVIDRMYKTYDFLK